MARRAFWLTALALLPLWVLLSRDFAPTNRLVETPLNRFPMRFVDSAAVLDQSAKWEKRYADIFGAQGR